MEKTQSEKQIFVLVHGAWAGPFAWQMVKDTLESSGNEVVALQLPGHGTDNTPAGTLHMDTYINYVSGAIEKIGRKVILVGHSLAGMIISGVAEQVPGLVEKLVYIAGYVPQNGQSAYMISLEDTQSLLGASLIVSNDQSEFDIKREDIINIVCQDGTEEVQELILNNYKAEPAAPFSDPISLSDEKFGSVEKYYIETLQDHGIGNELQKRMIAQAKIKNSYQLNSGHTPLLSQPAELSNILQVIAQH
ncbi:pimeloyl-ACP methyl ester carboxylesterase [Mucilaginibacter oryzae]|uniref:Pimeloyl-ACP methyl ester carboxylesterase n=1 Tax=Mucilaginibacter oryzae TaxID=468058 RepID=A0A316HI58_9SPHI|nr:alpha/beta fold hydrolase [Mucilaginibacter oryzae]PWK79823.1 pimeloyl-ACP methyl ester carboxylesterase [Mucilaginibacter oryzae]